MMEPEPDCQDRSMPGAVAFGAVVGILHGAAAGAVCCWLAKQTDHYVPAAAIGAAVGTLIGGVIGYYRRKPRGGDMSLDIGTWTALCCGAIPAMMIFAGIGVGFGKLGIGAMFICPMLGLITGGLCDRVYESRLRHAIRNREED